MWRNALIATITVLVGFLLVVFSQIDFLLPYKRYIVTQYATRLEVYVGMFSGRRMRGRSHRVGSVSCLRRVWWTANRSRCSAPESASRQSF